MALLLHSASIQIINSIIGPFSKRKIRLVELADILVNELKIKRNDVIMVHAGLKSFKLADASHEDLIYLLKMMVGRGGSIIMPANDKNEATISSTSAVNRIDLSRNGNLFDTFSLLPETLVNCSGKASFAVWGKMKDYFDGTYSYLSLYDKLYPINAKIIGIGASVADLKIPSEHIHGKDLVILKKKGITFFRLNF